MKFPASAGACVLVMMGLGLPRAAHGQALTFAPFRVGVIIQ